MEAAGWVLLLTSWIALSTLVWFCLRRVLNDEAAENARRRTAPSGRVPSGPARRDGTGEP
jgi:hypothetical protein